MSALAATHPTLLDLARSVDPDGNIATVVEILNQDHGMLEDMVWMEGNLDTGHRTSIRTGLPAPTWRSMYGGVQPTKSTKAVITDTCGMLEAYAEVDKALADIGGRAAAYRFQEDMAFIEGISKELSETLLYGNDASAPAEFTGLSPRYNSLSAENADNILDAGGTGSDNRSIWLVVWGPNYVHGIVPKGSQAGIQVRDLGEVTLESAVDGNGGRMQIYRTHYRVDAGLTLKDWRYVVRICNIDRSALTKDASAGADLPDLMYQALRLPPSLNGRAVFYMSRDVQTFMQRQLAAATNQSTLTTENVGGVMTDMFQGVPIRRVDAMAADEARVV